MKQINVNFENKEFKKIIRVKDIVDISWHDFIIMLVENSQIENKLRNIENE